MVLLQSLNKGYWNDNGFVISGAALLKLSDRPINARNSSLSFD
jgi:hypothetical protein